jgi:polyhydroxybutyrate depolymerase
MTVTARLLVAASLALACTADRTEIAARSPTASEGVTPQPEATRSAAANAAAKSGCGLAALPSGQSEHRLISGGIDRRFLLYVPPGTAPRVWPVVLNFHGSGGTPEGQLATSNLAVWADREHFALVAPAAVDNRWNIPPDSARADDVRFTADVLDTVATLLCVDPQRVYATGFSGGGRMSSQLACDLSTRIAAIAAVGGIRFPGPCGAARSIPILAFHGTADETNPYAGGGQPYWGTGVEAAIDGWAAHNGCGPRVEQPRAPGLTELRYAKERCGEVVLFRIEGLGHTWPGQLLPNQAEGTANDLLWQFFTRHPRL